MKNKNLIVTGIILTILVVTGLVTSYADSARVRNGVEPKFVIKITTDDGNKVTYWGLGYKVVRYPSVSPNEPYKNNRGVKYGSWFMNYELEEDIKLSAEDVNTKIQEYFTKEKEESSNLVYNYVDDENGVVIVGLLDDSDKKQEEFIYNVFSNCCGSTYIKYIEDNNMIKFEKAEPNQNLN